MSREFKVSSFDNLPFLLTDCDPLHFKKITLLVGRVPSIQGGGSLEAGNLKKDIGPGTLESTNSIMMVTLIFLLILESCLSNSL